MEHSSVQAVVIIALIIAAGLGLGKIRVKGISLGVTWVFFAGIFAGHIGLSIDPAMLAFAQNFGLVLLCMSWACRSAPDSSALSARVECSSIFLALG